MGPKSDGSEALLDGEVDVIFAEIAEDAQFRLPRFRPGHGCCRKSTENSSSGHLVGQYYHTAFALLNLLGGQVLSA